MGLVWFANVAESMGGGEGEVVVESRFWVEILATIILIIYSEGGGGGGEGAGWRNIIYDALRWIRNRECQVLVNDSNYYLFPSI